MMIHVFDFYCDPILVTQSAIVLCHSSASLPSHMNEEWPGVNCEKHMIA